MNRHTRCKQRNRWSYVAVLAAGLVASSTAHADDVDKIARRLVKLDAEVLQISSGVQSPRKRAVSADLATRRLIDAQVAFGVGNYDDAAVMLYDYVEQFPNSKAFDEALYYLGEALFQKGDNVASRTYFTKLVTKVGATSKFYQQGLERLIELSLRLKDTSKVTDWLKALQSVPASKRRSSVPYVQGKYAYFSNKFSDAITHFNSVPRQSKFYFQAQYFIGTSNVALKKLGAASKIFRQITKLKTTKKGEKRVIELAHMALGRVHYERDQASKAIDHYLRISRRSDLFDEALYEVAWVYVKNQQFDKALRALELLSLTDPNSSKMPEVRILEGNLRIRKAQKLAISSKGNSTEEYAKALKVFTGTKDLFKKPHDELVRIIDKNADAKTFFAQITGRVSETLKEQTTLPPVAASWIREQPDVKRVVTIETDLGQIKDEIATAERTIKRLEQALTKSAGVNVFPKLAGKRNRAIEVLEEIFGLRERLAARLRAIAMKYANPSEKASLERLRKERKKLTDAFAMLPNAKLKHSRRVEAARNKFVKVDQRAAEIRVVVDQTEATLVALERYLKDRQAAGAKPKDLVKFTEAITKWRSEVNGMKKELRQIRREGEHAKDAAGTGDQVAKRARLLRTKIRLALEDEHRMLMKIVPRMSGKDATKANQISTLVQTANSITLKLDEANKRIERVVEVELREVRASVRVEKARLSAYNREFLEYEAESRTLGGKILSDSFVTVKKKLYDVLIRSDVGVIDVTWSQKEAADESVKRLRLKKQKEMQTLQDEFRTFLDEERKQKQQKRQEQRKRNTQQKQMEKKLFKEIGDKGTGTAPGEINDPNKKKKDDKNKGGLK